jgi:hypothetical protein
VEYICIQELLSPSLTCQCLEVDRIRKFAPSYYSEPRSGHYFHILISSNLLPPPSYTFFLILKIFWCRCPDKRSQGKAPKKNHKAEREKLKRDQLNDLFVELSSMLG